MVGQQRGHALPLLQAVQGGQPGAAVELEPRQVAQLPEPRQQRGQLLVLVAEDEAMQPAGCRGAKGPAIRGAALAATCSTRVHPARPARPTPQ